MSLSDSEKRRMKRNRMIAYAIGLAGLITAPFYPWIGVGMIIGAVYLETRNPHYRN